MRCLWVLCAKLHMLCLLLVKEVPCLLAVRLLMQLPVSILARWGTNCVAF